MSLIVATIALISRDEIAQSAQLLLAVLRLSTYCRQTANQFTHQVFSFRCRLFGQLDGRSGRIGIAGNRFDRGR